MTLDTHLTLQGEYSIDVFNRDGTLSYSLGPFKNFITSTGLSYPHNFAFADCFRFLSIGLGNAKNTIKSSVNGGWGTVNLQTPMSQYSYIGGRETQYDFSHQTSQYTSASFSERPSGISISRGWRVPSGTSIGDQVFFDNDYTFKEVMLSPGRPFVTGMVYNPDVINYFTVGPPSITLGASSITHSDNQGWSTNQWTNNIIRIFDSSLGIQERTITSNTATVISWNAGLPVNTSDPNYYEIHRRYQLCHCLDIETDIEGNQRNGLDYSSSSIYYSGEAGVSPCNATGAFVRIVKDIPVTKDNFLVFNYTLFIDIETGRVDFAFDMKAGRNSRTTKDSNWFIHSVSGSHNLIHNGLKLISPGTVTTYTPFGAMTQDGVYWDADRDFGESFMTSWGAPLEPSTLFNRLSAYLTSDNLQFFANSKDGGQSGAGIPGFSGQSGLMLWRSTPYKEVITGGGFDTRLYNIRQSNSVDAGGQRAWPFPTTDSPNGFGYVDETTTPEQDPPSLGGGGFNYTPQHLTTTFQTSVQHWDGTTNTPSSRTREVLRSFQFAGPSVTNGFIGVPIRGIVLSYTDPNYTNYHFPYLDCLFVDSGVSRPRIIPQALKTNPGTYTTGSMAIPGSQSYWYYLDSDAKLTFSFKETWSSPCSPDVDGC